MKIMVVEDEIETLADTVGKAKEAASNAVIAGFYHEDEADLFYESMNPEVVMLSLGSKEYDGLALAGRLQDRNPNINIIFISDNESRMREAFAMHASGYLIRPVTKEMVRSEIERLRYPVEIGGKRVTIRAFGSFEVFVDGVPMHFRYTKTKEMLAYLVDKRGALCTMEELGEILWPGERAEHFSYLNGVRTDLIKSFNANGCGNAIVKRRGVLAVVPEQLECDLYDWEADPDRENRPRLNGYMNQYPWATLHLETN